MPNPNSKPLSEQLGTAALLLVVLVLFYTASDTLLVIFGSFLAAFFLLKAAGLACERWGGNRKVWVASLLLAGLVLAGGFFALAGSQLQQQAEEIGPQLSQSLQQLEEAAKPYPPIESAVRNLKEQSSEFSLERVQIIFSGALGVLSSLALAAALILYVSFQPQPYEKGVRKVTARLVGDQQARSFLRSLSDHLWGFLGGQLKAMSVIAIVTTCGLWLLGIPMFFVLGIMAGLFAFVPVLGPMASTIPAVLIALPQGTTTVLWVLGLYAGVQLVESNFLTPVLQQQNSSLPPVLTLSFQAVMGALAGPLGVLLAAPAAVFALVAGEEWLKSDEDVNG